MVCPHCGKEISEARDVTREEYFSEKLEERHRQAEEAALQRQQEARELEASAPQKGPGKKFLHAVRKKALKARHSAARASDEFWSSGTGLHINEDRLRWAYYCDNCRCIVGYDDINGGDWPDDTDI